MLCRIWGEQATARLGASWNSTSGREAMRGVRAAHVAWRAGGQEVCGAAQLGMLRHAWPNAWHASRTFGHASCVLCMCARESWLALHRSLHLAQAQATSAAVWPCGMHHQLGFVTYAAACAARWRVRIHVPCCRRACWLLAERSLPHDLLSLGNFYYSGQHVTMTQISLII